MMCQAMINFAALSQLPPESTYSCYYNVLTFLVEECHCSFLLETRRREPIMVNGKTRFEQDGAVLRKLGNQVSVSE